MDRVRSGCAPGRGPVSTLNCTGSTTFTLMTGVREELFRSVPVMAVGGSLAGVTLLAGWLVGAISW